MCTIDRIIVAALVVAIVAVGAAFAVFSFHDSIRAAAYQGAKEVT